MAFGPVNVPGISQGGSAQGAAAFFAGPNPPGDTGRLWIDTTEGAGGLKYYDGSAWTAVPVIWG